LGGFSDHDSGGWIIPELEKNIRICAREKTEKIAGVRARYPEWWLILVDHIGYGQEEHLSVEHDWDRVVLISPVRPEIGFDV
jgi:hypothetical protein